MSMQPKGNRMIGLDMHPDLFTAAALEGHDAATAKVQWVHDRQQTAHLERWAKKHLHGSDIVVLEASGNSFEVAARLHAIGITTLVLESVQAGKIRENFCNNDRSSAVKLARVYLSGLAKVVWQPDEKTRERREVLFAYRNAVKDATRQRNRIRGYLSEHCVRLPEGTRLTQDSGLEKALSLREWSDLQRELLKGAFEQLWNAQRRRKSFEQIMARELTADPRYRHLVRLMGVRHIVAFALMALVGDIHRFPNPKKLVGYLGLSPRRDQSGNDPQGKEKGLGRGGRRDLRALLLQSAHNALKQRTSPLHRWGWKLLISKHRNVAAAAVARKLTVAIWHLLMGHYSHLQEASKHLEVKLLKIATLIGLTQLRAMGFKDRRAFSQYQIQQMQLSS